MAKVLLVALLLVATAGCQSQAQATKEVVLPSGKKVKVIAVGQINFSNDRPALMLKYQTDLKVSNTAELRKEVEEIWATFRAEVEQAKLTNAIISANEAPQGTIIKTASAFNFVYRRSADGTWKLASDTANQPQKK
jgi:hypothetical protein